jgi:hypothetical protein
MKTTLAEINQSNAEFWAAQRVLLEEGMADEAIRETAVEAMATETRKGLPLFYQKSIYESLADADRARQRFMSQHARKGGLAAKTDRLQTLIAQIVQGQPNISVRELEAKLRRHQDNDPLQEIDDGIIYFTDPHGRTRKAKLSGLKDRLSREKKKIASR